jgi:RNA polymerase sigma-70 factor (ECF subfamily)
MSSEEETIVAAVLARTPGAFERLVERHQKLAWHMVHRMVQQPEETRELCQEVFLRVFQRLHQFRFESTLATWIGRIAFSVASRHLRRKRLPIVDLEKDDEHPEAPIERIGDGFDLQQQCERDDMLARLARVLGDLPPLQRTLVTLYHLDELPIADIAAITGLPDGTIKSHLFRARLKMREQLQ